MHKPRVSICLLIILALVAAQLHSAPETVTITILGTSDVHGQIFNYNYENDEVDNNGSMVQVSALVNSIRKENPNTILIDSGDILQGTPLTDDLYNTVLVKEPHPVVKAMNFMKYDSMTLGNHEFNFGLDLIRKFVQEADFPVIAANVFNKDDGSSFVKPYTIVERGGVRVGIIGAVIPSVPMWDGPKVASLDFKDIHLEVKTIYDKLINEDLVDIVVVSTHTGLEGMEGNKGTAAQTVLDTTPDIAVLFIGHDHASVSELKNGVSVVGPRNSAKEIARVDLTLEKQGKKWQIVGNKPQLISVNDHAVDDDLFAKLSYAHEKTLEFINVPVATATANFLPDFEFEHEHIPAALLMDTALMDLINNVQLQNVPDSDISVAALLFPNANLKAGPISYRNVFDIYRYPNTLSGVEISGKELREYIESTARFYNTFTPGDVLVSFSPTTRAYSYDVVQGVEYEIDVSKKPGERLTKLERNGKPVKDDDKFKLAINSYTYSVMKKFGRITNDAYFTSDPVSLRAMIFDYVKNKGNVVPKADENWRLAGISSDHWAREHAVNLINNKIIDIKTGTRVYNIEAINLESSVTRKQFFQALARTLKLAVNEKADVSEISIKDADETILPYAVALINHGVQILKDGDMLYPDRDIQRDDAILYTFQALKVQPGPQKSAKVIYKDEDKLDQKLRPLLHIVDKHKLLEAEESGNFNPGNPLKRGEKARLLDAVLTGEIKSN